jgi:hypothetical protein
MQDLIAEEARCVELRQRGIPLITIAQMTGLSSDQVYRRLQSAKKRARLDPEIVRRLEAEGLRDLGGVHSGWSITKDATGSGSSIYFHLGPDQDKIDLAEALRASLSKIPRLEPIRRLRETRRHRDAAKNFANWLMLADLHFGAGYGTAALEAELEARIDELAARMPPAEKAFIFELGDLLDANDHKGVTPASGNPCDVMRDDMLSTTQAAVRSMRRGILRLAETHDEVEVHLIPGNHDPTAFIAVLLTLEAHFERNPRVRIHVPRTKLEEDFRVVPWGECAVFPHHGHTASWEDLRNVWTDQFPDEWARAKAFRLIATAHFHHDRKRDLVGCVGEHYRTLHNPNKWARNKCLFNRGSLTGITVDKNRGEFQRTITNVKLEYTPVASEVSLNSSFNDLLADSIIPS